MNVYYEGRDDTINELYHYGVLGMKWGVRRANKLQQRAGKHRRNAKEDLTKARDLDNESASYAKAAKKATGKKADKLNKMARSAKNDAESYRESAKEWEEIAKANMSKSNKIRTKHEKLGGKETLKLVENTKTGKLVAQSLVFGTYGALKYNQSRTNKNTSRGRAALNGLVYGTINTMSGGVVSIVEPRPD